MTTIVGIKTSNRIDNAAAVQQVLTKYGCIIKTRKARSVHGELYCL